MRFGYVLKTLYNTKRNDILITSKRRNNKVSIMEVTKHEMV